MGSSASRPVTQPTTTTTTTSSSSNEGPEKVGFPIGRSNSLRLPNHHSADRLSRIQADAALGQRLSAADDADVADRPASKSIAAAQFKRWDAAIEQDPVARLAQLCLHGSSPADALHRRKAEVADMHVFNTMIPYESHPVTNQMSSGRCWLFATTNVIRNEMIPKLNIEDFQLSQSYLHFWDKLEKANYFLESTLALYDRPVDERVYGYLKGDICNDGGQADMAFNLLRKYGVVPQAVYPESFNTSNTSQINSILKRRLREDAAILRDMKNSTVSELTAKGVSQKSAEAKADYACQKRKDAMMEEIYRVMVTLDGAPPHVEDEFTFEYRDKSGKFRSITSKPRDFLAKYAPNFDVDSQASLLDDPRHPEGTLITIDRLNNVAEGRPVAYVNTSMRSMKLTAINMLQSGLPVFFGCDSGAYADGSRGIWDESLFDYESAFGFKFGMTKKERIDYGESAMTHAMVWTGCHLVSADGSDEGDDDVFDVSELYNSTTPLPHLPASKQPKKVKVRSWRIENSWSDTRGDKGYFMATDAWVSGYVFQVVGRKKFISKKDWDIFQNGTEAKEGVIVLPPYDPMGALA